MAKLVHDVQKRQHRERSQLNERKRFGHLEKKKDYQKRSKNYHAKQATLSFLKQKVKERNPDEYYHAMNKSKLGVTQRNNAENNQQDLNGMSNDQAKLLKTQDVNYIRTLRLNEVAKIDKLKEGLKFESRGDHKIFVDSKESLEKFNATEYFNTTKELLHRRENRLSKDQLSVIRSNESNNQQAENTSSKILKKQKKNSLKMATNLKRHIERSNKLLSLENKMNYNNELLKKGSKKKIVKDGVRTFKWKKQRKR